MVSTKTAAFRSGTVLHLNARCFRCPPSRKLGLSEASLDRVHDRLIGRPGPCVGLTKLPDYMRSFDDVWSLTPRPTLPFIAQQIPSECRRGADYRVASGLSASSFCLPIAGCRNWSSPPKRADRQLVKCFATITPQASETITALPPRYGE
jgi:hypothetical protein